MGKAGKPKVKSIKVKAVKIKYESADVITDGALTINGLLTGSKSDSVENTTHGLTTTL